MNIAEWGATVLLKYIRAYLKRVAQDSGLVKNKNLTNGYYNMAKKNGILNSIRFAWMGEAGGKFRVSTIYTYWTKIYSMFYPSARYGSELISNGGFDTDSIWTKGAGWTINNGVATYDGLNGTMNIYQQNIIPTVFSIGKKYSVRVKVVSNMGSGNNTINNGTDIINSSHLNAGEYSFTFTSTVNSTLLNIYGRSGEVFVVDNVSVVEVLSDGLPTDATQTTAGNQPFVSGNIAPNEKLALKNPNGDDCYMTHPTISFGASDAWSVTTVVYWTGVYNYTSPIGYCGDASTSTVRVISSTNTKVVFINSLSTSTLFSKDIREYIGKNLIITLSANGLGQLSLYLNGVFSETVNVVTSFNFSSILYGRSVYFNGYIHAHIIRSQALTASQVAAEASYLRSIYPEIPSVTIGSQTWATSNCEMVCTPQGNLIQNITENTFVEKITVAADRDFSSDTGFWTKSSATVTISGGLCNFSSSPQGAYINRGATANANKWHKIVYTVTGYTSGSIRFSFGSGVNGTLRTGNGTYTEYLYSPSALGLYFEVLGTGTTNVLSIDDVSVQEIGWANSTELYDAVYAATAGTVEQKTYAGVKAAAMWCYYNNDATIGAVYGKLYNWYAVKLLQMDIDYYNAANPTTLWGWKVPESTDFSTLATTLGGASVAGGKMKKEGLNYWGSPNTGADNRSGLSLIGAGRRTDLGVADSITASCVLIAVDEVDTNTSYASYVTSTAIEYVISNSNNKKSGRTLRLIKS